EADPGLRAERVRVAELHAAQRALPHVVDAPERVPGVAVVPLLAGDGGGRARAAGLVPEGDGEDGGLGGDVRQPAMGAVAGGEGPCEGEREEARAQGVNSSNSLLPISLSVHAHSGEALTCCDLQEDAPKCVRTTRAAC